MRTWRSALATSFLHASECCTELRLRLNLGTQKLPIQKYIKTGRIEGFFIDHQSRCIRRRQEGELVESEKPPPPRNSGADSNHSIDQRIYEIEQRRAKAIKQIENELRVVKEQSDMRKARGGCVRSQGEERAAALVPRPPPLDYRSLSQKDHCRGGVVSMAEMSSGMWSLPPQVPGQWQVTGNASLQGHPQQMSYPQHFVQIDKGYGGLPQHGTSYSQQPYAHQQSYRGDGFFPQGYQYTTPAAPPHQAPSSGRGSGRGGKRTMNK